MIAVKANVFGGVQPLLSYPEIQFPHSFMRGAEEVLKCPRPFGIILPKAERPPLARQGPTNQHYLDNVDKIDILLNEASDAAL